MSDSDDCRLRTATVDDAATLTELYHDAYAETVDAGFPMSAAWVERREVESWIRDHQVCVAVVDDELAGAVRLSDNGDETVRLSRLGVAVDWKGDGLGDELLSYAEERARTDGWERIRLTTPEDHPYLPAMYRRRGYERVGTQLLDERPYDEMVLEKEL